jgi:hypothetical protein
MTLRGYSEAAAMLCEMRAASSRASETTMNTTESGRCVRVAFDVHHTRASGDP